MSTAAPRPGETIYWVGSPKFTAGDPTRLVNSRTAGSGKGVVPEAVISASIALDALLLRGDLAELKGAGFRFRAGTETAITRELRAIPIDRHHLIDHHYIAGRLKPSCWRPWADDPVGFPRARYLAALAPAPSAPEETVNSYPVPKVPSVATVPAGTWLYATSALEPSPDTSVSTRGATCPTSASRRARFASSSTSTRRASIRVARCSPRRPRSPPAVILGLITRSRVSPAT